MPLAWHGMFALAHGGETRLEEMYRNSEQTRKVFAMGLKSVVYFLFYFFEMKNQSSIVSG